MARPVLLERLILFTCALCFAFAQASEIEVRIHNLRNKKGRVALSLFAKEKASSFPARAEDALKSAYQEISGGELLVIKLKDVPSGAYGLALMHDENSDRKLNTFIGMPKEGFGFSSNPTIYFGPPPFSKIEFNHGAEKSVVDVDMKYLL